MTLKQRAQALREAREKLGNTTFTTNIPEFRDDISFLCLSANDLPAILDFLDEAVKALEYVQFVHIEKLGKAMPGVEVAQWALEHNASYARETLRKWEGE